MTAWRRQAEEDLILQRTKGAEAYYSLNSWAERLVTEGRLGGGDRARIRRSEKLSPEEKPKSRAEKRTFLHLENRRKRTSRRKPDSDPFRPDQ